MAPESRSATALASTETFCTAGTCNCREGVRQVLPAITTASPKSANSSTSNARLITAAALS